MIAGLNEMSSAYIVEQETSLCCWQPNLCRQDGMCCMTNTFTYTSRRPAACSGCQTHAKHTSQQDGFNPNLCVYICFVILIRSD